LLAEALAEQFARSRSSRHKPMTPEGTFAGRQLNASELSVETPRRPRIVLIARDASPPG
jgi:hypothetical protein